MNAQTDELTENKPQSNDPRWKSDCTKYYFKRFVYSSVQDQISNCLQYVESSEPEIDTIHLVSSIEHIQIAIRIKALD